MAPVSGRRFARLATTLLLAVVVSPLAALPAAQKPVTPQKQDAAYGAKIKELGKKVFTDGALSKKQKELMALAVAISQNCFD